MQALQGRLARANRQVVLKRRRLEVEQKSVVTPSQPESQSSHPPSHTNSTMSAPRSLCTSGSWQHVAMSPPRRLGSDDVAIQPSHMTIGDILRDKPMRAMTKGVVVAHCDAAIPNGVPRHIILLAWGNFCVPLVVWRDQVQLAARIAAGSMDKVIVVDKVK